MEPARRTISRPLARRTSDLGMLLGGLALLTLCAIPASSGDFGPIEQQAFETINGLSDA